VCLAVSLSGLRRLGRDRAVLPGLFVPAATQRLVQIDFTGQLRKAVTDQRLLRAEQGALRSKERQVAVDTNPITKVG